MSEKVRELAKFATDAPPSGDPGYAKWRDEVERRWDALSDAEKKSVQDLDPRVKASHSKAKRIVEGMWAGLGVTGKIEGQRSLTREEIGEDILAVGTATASVLGAYIGTTCKNEDNRAERVREGFKMLNMVVKSQLAEVEHTLLKKFEEH